MNWFRSRVFTLLLLTGCGVSGQIHLNTHEASVGNGSKASESHRNKRIEAAIVLKEATVHGNPQTEVMLQLSGAIDLVTSITTVKAPCAQKTVQTNELIRVECWWAGAGETLVVKAIERALLITKQQSTERGTTKTVKLLKKLSLKGGQRVSAKLSTQ